MQAFRIETVIKPNGTLVVENLPLAEGAKVELIILSQPVKTQEEKNANPYPLRGTPYQYEEPFEPVAAEDWEVLK